MWFMCRCLNVGVHVDVVDYGVTESNTTTSTEPVPITDRGSTKGALQPSPVEDDVDDPFFFGRVTKANAIDKDAVTTMLPSFVRTHEAGSWRIHHCHLCDMDVYASRLEFPSEVFINLNLLHNPEDLAAARESKNFSSIFQVVLPAEPLAVDAAVETDSEFGGYTLISRSVSTALQSVCSEFLRKERDEMSERIRVFIDEQHAQFEHKRRLAKEHKALLLRQFAKSVVSKSLSNGEDDDDSAVPLSPVSQHSGDTSPASLMLSGNELSHAVGRINLDDQLFDGGFRRPKAYSNPSGLTAWKRRRHKAGDRRSVDLPVHVEENHLAIFPMDDDDVSVVPYALPDEEESDTDDEQVITNAPRQLCTPPLQKVQDSQLGTSLPILIPTYRPPTMHNFSRVDEEVNDDDVGSPAGSYDGEDGHCVDVAASIRALARSIQAADDPERLFGELPQRRRCKFDDLNLSAGAPEMLRSVGFSSHVHI